MGPWQGRMPCVRSVRDLCQNRPKTEAEHLQATMVVFFTPSFASSLVS